MEFRNYQKQDIIKISELHPGNYGIFANNTVSSWQTFVRGKMLHQRLATFIENNVPQSKEALDEITALFKPRYTRKEFIMITS